MFLNAPLCVVIYKTNGNFGRDNVDEILVGIICLMYYDNLIKYLNIIKILAIICLYENIFDGIYMFLQISCFIPFLTTTIPGIEGAMCK